MLDFLRKLPRIAPTRYWHHFQALVSNFPSNQSGSLVKFGFVQPHDPNGRALACRQSLLLPTRLMTSRGERKRERFIDNLWRWFENVLWFLFWMALRYFIAFWYIGAMEHLGNIRKQIVGLENWNGWSIIWWPETDQLCGWFIISLPMFAVVCAGRSGLRNAGISALEISHVKMINPRSAARMEWR